MRILATSDIHIGRIPSVPNAGADITGRRAWEDVVQCALDQRVQAVLLAGDVVEHDSAWFEAYGPLKKGLARLKERGIAVVAVAGNHDARVFPSLASDSDAVTILGLGGKWEALDLGPIRILGWSFPSTAHKGNPMEEFQEEFLADGKPYIGLLHCDLDGPSGSHYAPVPSRALERTGAAAWVLGHIHRGGLKAGDRAFYCGSPLALDAGEEGEHGVWLMDLNDCGQITHREMLPLSPWMFRTLSVDMEGVGNKEDAREQIRATLEGAALEAQGGPAETYYCSLRMQGACGLTGSLARHFQEDLPSMEVPAGNITVRPTGRIVDETTPPLEVAEIAKGKGIRASLARILLQAQDPGGTIDEVPDLFSRMKPLLPPGSDDPEIARHTLATAARRLMMNIEKQRGEA